MSTHLHLNLNQADLEQMIRLAQRRGLDDLTTYIRELMEADALRQLPERELVVERLRAAGLLVDDWRALDANHLVSALQVRSALELLIFVSADQQQLHAATAQGFETDD